MNILKHVLSSRTLSSKTVFSVWISLLARSACLWTLLWSVDLYAQYQPADDGQKPASAKLLPEQFLRGYDPVTVYFSSSQNGKKGPADDGAKKLQITPAWPGAYVWLDESTLQFRPAEPWPELTEFQFSAAGKKYTLKTMVSPPLRISPSDGSTELRPFRNLTLTFPQTFDEAALRRMLRFELKELPGVADLPGVAISRYRLEAMPRASFGQPTDWVVSFEEEIPEGKVLLVEVSLSAANEKTHFWRARLSTRQSFVLQSVQCGSASFMASGGANVAKEAALGCGNRGDLPVLVFSAPIENLDLTTFRKLVRLQPAVADLRFETYGKRVQLVGKFLPDTLYRMTIAPAPIRDDSGRVLHQLGNQEVHFHLGWKESFLRFNHSNVMLETHGPRVLPLRGFGDTVADVRIFRINPLHEGLWPFPNNPLYLNDNEAPPFPGEEPEPPSLLNEPSRRDMVQHIRMLGSPLVSTWVDLPLAQRNTTTFGLDIGTLLDAALGKKQPGTYLIGLRRAAAGNTERAFVRAQITNLSVSSVEEAGETVLFVRRLDNAAPVVGATVVLEGKTPNQNNKKEEVVWQSKKTDAQGKVVFLPEPTWESILRVHIKHGEDILVLNPAEPLPSFANNHWHSGSTWLYWMSNAFRVPETSKTMGFVVTDSPIYRPGDLIQIKAWVREREMGNFKLPSASKKFKLLLKGEDNSWELPVTQSALGGLSATFDKKDIPSGHYSVWLMDRGTLLSSRDIQVEPYRLPTFEVQLLSENKQPNDKPFKVTALARYYAGGNLSNNPISWFVTQRPYYWVPQNMPGFLFASSMQFGRTPSVQPQEKTTRSESLDEAGSASLVLNPQLDMDGSARSLTIEAVVSGPDGQSVANYAEVRVLPSFVLGMKLPRFLEKASHLSPQIVAMGFDDKLLAGQELSVRLYHRAWHSHLRETSFATGKPRYHSQQTDTLVAEKNIVTKAEPVGVDFAIDKAGVYVVELVARDKMGRVQTLTADLYAGGESPVAWQKSRDGVFELKTDKPSYAPNERARILVQSPFVEGKALVVVEHPEGNQYFWKEVAGSKATVEIPLSPKNTPNLPVHVVLMRGRIGQGKTDDSRYKPMTVAGSLELVVRPESNTLNVQVEHPEVVRPGTKQEFVIKLTDEKNRPLSGEVTLWLVDEAVLSLAKEGSLNPLPAMVLQNRPTSSIRDTRNKVLGMVAELEEEPGGGGEDEMGISGIGGGSFGAALVRKIFKVVPYYAETLLVPASGKLVVPIQLSDDLTNFSVRAIAVSGANRFGWKRSTLKQRLPLLVQPQLPRFIRSGDVFWPGALVRTIEDGGAVEADILVSGLASPAKLNKKFELEKNKPATVALSLEIPSTLPSNVSKLTIRSGVMRTKDKVGDVFLVDLPILADRPPESAASSFSLAPGKTELATFPEAPREGSATQNFVATNQPGILEAAASFNYLLSYQHASLEQRIARMLPLLSLKALTQLLGFKSPAQNVDDSAEALLLSIQQQQAENGLVAWWPGSEGDIGLTASAVEFMVAAQKSGFSLDGDVYKKALQALKASLRSNYAGLWSAYRYNQQTSSLRALAVADSLDDNYLVELFHQRKSMDVASIADLAIAMHKRKELYSSQLEELKKELWQSAIFKLVKGKEVFDRLQNDRQTWGAYLGSATASLAVVWEALLTLDSENPKHLLLREALLSKSNMVRGFGDTYANRRALNALALFLSQPQNLQASSQLEIEGIGKWVLDGKNKVVISDTTSTEKKYAQLEGAALLLRQQMKFIPAETGDKIDSKQSGFVVSRNMTHIQSPPAHYEDLRGTTRELKMGDVVEVHANLSTSEERHYVVFVVPFAAGLELLNPALQNTSSEAITSQTDSTPASYVERRDSEVRYYFTLLPKGSHNFHFRLRAASQGNFIHPPPYAEMLYQDEIRGRGLGMRIRVLGEQEK
ncbi:MAG: hypothetical protein FWG75_00665 [Cystobacterineae bacterium]|nr:hypothetical protein [Cystobacterineae bacterium]